MAPWLAERWQKNKTRWGKGEAKHDHTLGRWPRKESKRRGTTKGKGRTAHAAAARALGAQDVLRVRVDQSLGAHGFLMSDVTENDGKKRAEKGKRKVKAGHD